MTLQEAKKYLRERGKYIVDQDCKFKPTLAAATDVSKTIKAYQRDMEKVKTPSLPAVVRTLWRT